MNIDNAINSLVTMILVKGDTMNLEQILVPMVVLVLTGILKNIIPQIIPIMKNYFKKSVERKIMNNTSFVKKPKSFIRHVRDYTSNSKEQELTDAIIAKITRNDKVRNLVYREHYIFNTFEDVEIEDDLFVRLESLDIKNEKYEQISFVIFSYNKTLSELRKWIKDALDEYNYNKSFGFSEQQYYFNQVFYPTEKKKIIFDKNIFKTSKSLDNLYGKPIEKIKNRFNTFMNDEQWYIDKGLPHSFGLLLHGDPGTGKTSLIKALAHETKRHIFNVKIDKNTTASQIRNLFLTRDIFFIDNRTQQINFVEIPMSQRIIVFEDVDAMSDVLLSREFKKIDMEEKKQNEEKKKILGKDRHREYNTITEDHDKLTLSDVLNVLDGILEQPGRLVVFTTNHPEMLDKAFVRPGRIDMNIHFDKCDDYTLNQFFSRYYGECDYDFTQLEGFFTHARVQEVLLNNLHNPSGAYEELLKLRTDVTL